MGELKYKIIQAGMGAGVSNWRLANAVSNLGQLGIVSGTALNVILARRLQDGDPGGNIHRALDSFPFPKITKNILDRYFIPGGKRHNEPYAQLPKHSINEQKSNLELCIAGNFVEVFLAKEGHNNPVGINYLEKIQLPHLPSIYGAMLASVGAIIVGAGIPLEFPGIADALTEHCKVTYPVYIADSKDSQFQRIEFDPKDFKESDMPNLYRPDILPIVASSTLATMLKQKSNGTVNGFVVEGPLAGGHNAPPRGQLKLTEDGQPIYGQRDIVDLKVFRELGLPFWLAGSYGSHEKLVEALSEGASGIQVGTAFALCTESGITNEVRLNLIKKALNGQTKVFTDPIASPTGFPFKVAQLEGTLSEQEIYASRKRVCDLGFLRTLYRTPDGKIGYRCPAEPEDAFVAKGGKEIETRGRKCLCNALISNIGMPQHLSDGSYEKPLITLGDDFCNIGRFCSLEKPNYSAADVIRIILGK